ncbi:MAG: UDP-N-acetylmuramate dehydrogenase [Pseudomonadota bacterium]|nr:UDP-N-acetylmuramate dehydrogenase [Pseudomonadota bacterium]
MVIERNVSLQALNSFGIAARAAALVRVHSADDVRAVLAHAELAAQPLFVLGGGSNIVLTGDVKATVLKVQVPGMRVVGETARHTIVEAGAGERWHDLVAWTMAQRLPGLENLALIPGTVGAAPVQNIGAYGLELQDRFHELDAIDLHSGELFTLNAAQCGFGYRDSVFKHTPAQPGGLGLAGRALILRVRLALPKAWQPQLGYLDIERKMAEEGVRTPTAQQLFDWIVAIRRAKLPDPAHIGNAGSFFKNPTVTPEQCQDIIGRDPKLVHYPMPDGSVKLAAGWLIDACGWKGKRVGNAAVYDKQALVLINAGGPEQPVTGGEVMTLARAIQTSVYERFGIRLEPEPVVV